MAIRQTQNPSPPPVGALVAPACMTQGARRLHRKQVWFRSICIIVVNIHMKAPRRSCMFGYVNISIGSGSSLVSLNLRLSAIKIIAELGLCHSIFHVSHHCI